MKFQNIIGEDAYPSRLVTEVLEGDHPPRL